MPSFKDATVSDRDAAWMEAGRNGCVFALNSKIPATVSFTPKLGWVVNCPTFGVANEMVGGLGVSTDDALKSASKLLIAKATEHGTLVFSVADALRATLAK